MIAPNPSSGTRKTWYEPAPGSGTITADRRQNLIGDVTAQVAATWVSTSSAENSAPGNTNLKTGGPGLCAYSARAFVSHSVSDLAKIGLATTSSAPTASLSPRLAADALICRIAGSQARRTRDLDALAFLHAVEPGGERRQFGELFLALGKFLEIAKLRDRHQVGEAQHLAGEEFLVPGQPGDLAEAMPYARQRGVDRLLVGGAAEQRRHEPVIDDPGEQARRQIGVDDAHDLVHPRKRMQLNRLQRCRGKRLVDVAHDCLRLIEREAVVLEGGDAAERVAREMRLAAKFTGPDADQLMRDALLGQRQPHAPHIGAHR